MRQIHFYRAMYRLFSMIVLLSFLSAGLDGSHVLPARALTGEVAAQEEFIINTGMYQVPEDLFIALKTKLGEINDISGGATAFGVGYYEEHPSWAWISLLVANGIYFKEEEVGPSFLYFAARNAEGWSLAYAENNREYLSILDSLPRDKLSSEEVALLDGYYGLHQTKSNPMVPAGGLLFPWSSAQNQWRFSFNGFHPAGFQSLGVEPGAEAIDLLPPGSAQPAWVLAMENGMVVNKIECTWNTVLIIHHEGYPESKKFVYLHLQNGTSPVGIGMIINRGQYLGDLRTPVFNGYLSNGVCSDQGSGSFNCERDLNPATQNLCSTSTGRHLHLGFGADRNIVIDGNVVVDLTLGGRYNSTNTVNSGTPDPLSTDTTGVFRPSNGALYLKNMNITGFADIQINYGLAGDYPVVGDWDGDGDATIGIYRDGSFYLRNSNTIGFADIVFPFGAPGDQPIAGDWDGDGMDTIGVYRNGTFLLRNSNVAGAPEMSFGLGNPEDVAITGDWDGDGIDTTGVFRPSNGALYLKNTNATGFADIQINYGLPGDKPVTGDWDDDGVDTIGIYRNGTFHLRNSNTIGFADLVFALGVEGDYPIAGNWDGLP